MVVLGDGPQLKVTVLEDNDPLEDYRYLLSVSTGHRRGASTSSQVTATVGPYVTAVGLYVTAVGLYVTAVGLYVTAVGLYVTSVVRSDRSNSSPAPLSKL